MFFPHYFPVSPKLSYSVSPCLAIVNPAATTLPSHPCLPTFPKLGSCHHINDIQFFFKKNIKTTQKLSNNKEHSAEMNALSSFWCVFRLWLCAFLFLFQLQEVLHSPFWRLPRWFHANLTNNQTTARLNNQIQLSQQDWPLLPHPLYFSKSASGWFICLPITQPSFGRGRPSRDSTGGTVNPTLSPTFFLSIVCWKDGGSLV